MDLLDNQKFDSRFKVNSDASDKDRSKSKSKSNESTKTEPDKSFLQNKNSNFKCHCCGSPDHSPSTCPLKDKIDRSAWFKETGCKPTAKPAHAQTKSDKFRRKSRFIRRTVRSRENRDAAEPVCFRNGI